MGTEYKDTICECCLSLHYNGICHEGDYYSESCEASLKALGEIQGHLFIDTPEVLEPHFGSWCSLCGYQLAGNRFDASILIEEPVH